MMDDSGRRETKSHTGILRGTSSYPPITSAWARQIMAHNGIQCARHAPSRSLHVSFWQLSHVMLQLSFPSKPQHFTSSSQFVKPGLFESDAANGLLICLSMPITAAAAWETLYYYYYYYYFTR